MAEQSPVKGLKAPQCCGKKPDLSSAQSRLYEGRKGRGSLDSWDFIFSLGPSVREARPPAALLEWTERPHSHGGSVSLALQLPCFIARRPSLLTDRGGWARPPCSVVCLTNYATHRKT